MWRLFKQIDKHCTNAHFTMLTKILDWEIFYINISWRISCWMGILTDGLSNNLLTVKLWRIFSHLIQISWLLNWSNADTILNCRRLFFNARRVWKSFDKSKSKLLAIDCSFMLQFMLKFTRTYVQSMLPAKIIKLHNLLSIRNELSGLSFQKWYLISTEVFLDICMKQATKFQCDLSQLHHT